MDSTGSAVDPGTGPFRILFVCTGNVHRSASAELLSATAFARLLGTAGSTVEVRSAGTHACAGQPPDRATIPALIAFGVPGSAVESFRSRQLSGRQVVAADLVLVAEAEHRRSVWQLDIAARRRTFTVLEFAGLLAELDGPAPDPGGYVHNHHGVWPAGVRKLVVRADGVREPRRLADRGYDAAVPGIPDPAGETVEATTAAINRIADALQPVWLAIAAEIGPERDGRRSARDSYDRPGLTG